MIGAGVAPNTGTAIAVTPAEIASILALGSPEPPRSPQPLAVAPKCCQGRPLVSSL